jgi:hypothetical protein
MDTLLLVKTQDPTRENWMTPIDLYDNVSIQIDIQEGDLSGFERRSNYSKTFRVPATDNNSEIFKYFYEVNGTDYNPYAALPCVVQINGNDVFQGTLRLNGVYRNNLFDEYEVYILQELVDFNLSLGDKLLKDFNWTEYNHTQNYANITDSWEATTGDTAGLFGGDIIYPMINWGVDYTAGGVKQFDYCFGSAPCFNNTGYNLGIDNFKPAIRIKAIIDKIFEETGYNYNSDFFESPYFRLLYMDMGYDDTGRISSPGDGDNLNFFKVFTQNEEYLINYSGAFQTDGQYIAFKSLEPDGYDYLNNVFEGTNAYFAVPKTGTYAFSFRFSYTKVGTFNEDLRFKVYARKSTTLAGLKSGTIISQIQRDADDTDQQELFLFSDTLQTGEYVGLFVEFISVGAAGFNTFQTLIFKPYSASYAKPQWLLYNSPTLDLLDFEANKNLPDIKAIDFIRSIVQMFNLVFIVDDTKTITIEPFNYYFRDSNRVDKDWSDKLDTSSSYSIKPFSFDLAKEQNYTWLSSGEEVQGKYYEWQFNKIFGSRILEKESNILRGEETLEVPFRPLPTDVIDGSNYVIIPKCYRVDDEGKEVYTNTEPHLFFWLGNRYTYENYPSTTSSWKWNTGFSVETWTTYPAVSHLSNIESTNTDPSEFCDLNFLPTWDFFANTTSNVNQFTSNNTFTIFHSQTYNEKYSDEARKFVGKFLLTPQDIGQLKINDRIFVKDSFYRVEKITGASLTETKMTEVSLIKQIGGGFYWFDLPVDNPVIPPNDPIP